MLEFDIETTGLQNWYHEMFSAQFLGSDGQPITIRRDVEEDYEFEDSHPGELIQRYLDTAAEEGGIQAWNSKFDFGFAHQAGFELPPEHLWHDGMVKAHICDERFSAALKARGDRLFPGEGERDYETAVKEWLKDERKRRRDESKETGREYVVPTYQDVPRDLMDPYGEQDVVLQRKVSEVYDMTMKADPTGELHDLYEMERGVLAAYFWVEQRGVPVDREAAAKFEASLYDGREAREAELIRLAEFDNFNPNSTAQVAEALERRGLDLRTVPKTPTGRPKMDAEVLGSMDDELAAKVLAWKTDEKMLSTYLLPMLHGKNDKTWGKQAPFIQPDGRIHPNIRQVGARTGRSSVADPNMQNWHRDDLRMRYLVRAEPGKKLVTCDLDAVEMRVFAAFAGEGVLLDQVKRPDGDPHSFTAQMVGIRDTTRNGITTSARQHAKVFNFQMIYGGGINTVMKHFGVSKSRAQEMIHRYHQAYPEIGVLQSTVRARLEDRGYVKTPWGRKHRVYDERPVHTQAYAFINYLVQGTCADILKDAVVRIHKAGVPMILTVHDEILAEVDEADAEEVARIIQKEMTAQPRIEHLVPIDAEAMIVDRWSDAKSPGYVPDYMKEV